MVLSHTGFQPLKEIWLGDCYPEKFYYHLPNEIQDAFLKITEQTQQDLRYIQGVLKNFGVEVRRPKFTDSIDDYMIGDILSKPPIMPRDDNLVLGKDLYHLRCKTAHDPWQSTLDLYKDAGCSIIEQADGPIACLFPPSIVRVGRDVYIDYSTHSHIWDFVVPVLVDWSKKYRVHVCDTNGHSDGVFCPVAPNIIVASKYLSTYDNTFPNWEIYQMPHENTNGGFGKWHMEDKSILNNKRFSNHIEHFAIDWIGNCTETVFEVNMLVIDQKNVLAIKEDQKLFRWLEQRGIKVTLCDFRSRGFWDGGLHCLTVDIRRDGDCENYFFDRPDFNYLDWLL